MSVFGRIPDVEKTVTSDIKKESSALYLIGALSENMGGSTYYDINNLVGNEVPKVDLQVLPKVLRGIHKAINSGEVLACHDVSEGGVIGAVSEMAFGGNCGVKLELEQMQRPDMFLFNETAGMFVIEVKDVKAAEKLFGNLPHMRLGETTKDKKIIAKTGEKELFAASTDELKQAWQAPVKAIFG
jgi:phosphoribosylformylglycinamidine synthase